MRTFWVRSTVADPLPDPPFSIRAVDRLVDDSPGSMGPADRMEAVTHS